MTQLIRIFFARFFELFCRLSCHSQTFSSSDKHRFSAIMESRSEIYGRLLSVRSCLGFAGSVRLVNFELFRLLRVKVDNSMENSVFNLIRSQLHNSTWDLVKILHHTSVFRKSFKLWNFSCFCKNKDDNLMENFVFNDVTFQLHNIIL